MMEAARAYLLECGSPNAVIYMLSTLLDMGAHDDNAPPSDGGNSVRGAAVEEDHAALVDDMCATFCHNSPMPAFY